MGERDRRSGDRPPGVVLAGGLGARLGGAKAGVELAGRPLISYPLAALAAAGLERWVVAKLDSELPRLDQGTRVLVEPRAPRHPLCGIVAALRAAPGGAVLAVPCDMPFLTAAPLELLADAAEPFVVLAHRGRAQPLPGRYPAALLPELEAALARGEPLRRTAEALGARVVGEGALARLGDPRRLLFNVNDDEDLRRAEALLGRGPLTDVADPRIRL
jgi:molybdenum cofactor guanylyltransferase